MDELEKYKRILIALLKDDDVRKALYAATNSIKQQVKKTKPIDPYIEMLMIYGKPLRFSSKDE